MDDGSLSLKKGLSTSKIINKIFEVPIICFDSTRRLNSRMLYAETSWNNLTYQFPPWNSRACQASYIARNAKLPKVFRIRSDLIESPPGVPPLEFTSSMS